MNNLGFFDRIKRLWEHSALNEYFAKIDQERLAKQELKLERAERKTAKSVLHWWAVGTFGPVVAA